MRYTFKLRTLARVCFPQPPPDLHETVGIRRPIDEPCNHAFLPNRFRKHASGESGLKQFTILLIPTPMGLNVRFLAFVPRSNEIYSRRYFKTSLKLQRYRQRSWWAILLSIVRAFAGKAAIAHRAQSSDNSSRASSGVLVTHLARSSAVPLHASIKREGLDAA